MDFNAILAQRMRQLRESRGLGVRQLADELGISHSAISHYESQKRTPDVTICKKYAVYFGVTMDYLVGLDDCSIRKEKK